MHYQEERSPLGVIPNAIWCEMRIRDLSRSIYEYVTNGRFDKVYWWSKELTDVLRMREIHLDSKPAENSNVDYKQNTCVYH